MGKIAAASVFQPTILLALALMTVIVMMILPMPAWVLDVGLAASFALAILICAGVIKNSKFICIFSKFLTGC